MVCENGETKHLQRISLLAAATDEFSLGFRRCYCHFDIIVLLYFIDDRRCDPANNEDADDDAAEYAEVQTAKVVPQAAAQFELHDDNGDFLDRSHDKRHQHG